MVRFTTVEEFWVKLRRRILRETGQYVYYLLQHPEQAPAIPVVCVGQAEFTPEFAERFWDSVLFG
jgi:hypothetical protein